MSNLGTCLVLNILKLLAHCRQEKKITDKKNQIRVLNGLRLSLNNGITIHSSMTFQASEMHNAYLAIIKE